MAGRYLVIIILFLKLEVFSADLPPGFTEKLIAENLDPTDLVFVPDGRIFITIKSGKVVIIENDKLLPAPLLSIESIVDNYNERGLGHIVLDPNFMSNGYFYLYYTVKNENHNRVSRFTAIGNSCNPSSEVVILELDRVFGAIHNGGDMVFGPDGKLYISVGDGSNGNNAQALNNLLGKVLRINPDGSIPSDNPFVVSTTGANQAIWALGLRNPFSMDIQPGTGKIFVSDVGNKTAEEVNYIQAGKNYGWPAIEGKRTTQPLPTLGEYRDPLFSYSQGGGLNGGCAIVGACFYNPSTVQFPQEYVGKFFFADYCHSYIKYLDPEVPGAAHIFATKVIRPVGMVTASDGSMYYITRGEISTGTGDNTSSTKGALWKIMYSGSGQPFISADPKPVIVSIGEDAVFEVQASGTPPLSYQWQVNGNNILGANASSYTLAKVQAEDNAKLFRCIVSNATGSVTSNAAKLTVTVNTRPVPVIKITLPNSADKYRAGQKIIFEGSATDKEDGVLPASALTWKIDFHHDDHVHPAMDPTPGVASGEYTIPQIGEPSDNVWYRVYLTAMDKGQPALSETVYKDIHPEKTKIMLQTEPEGLNLLLDGQFVQTPYSFKSVVGVVRMLEALPTQSGKDELYVFDHWSGSDAENAFDLPTPEADKTFKAFYYSIPHGSGNGLTGQYFSDQDKTFIDPPTLTRIDSVINFSWGVNSPDPSISEDNFTVRWHGTILPQLTDEYTFHTVSDEGVRLWINDELIIDKWVDQKKREWSCTIMLEAGQHYPIQLEYYEKNGDAVVQLYWSNSVLSKQLIPKRQLKDLSFSSSLILYPTLAENRIQVDSNNEITFWKITNTLGQVMKHGESTLASFFVDVDTLPAGVYLFNANNKTTIRFYKK